jgi:hypothetical protein
MISKCRNLFLTYSAIRNISALSRAHKRGVSRSSRYVVRAAMDAASVRRVRSPDETSAAYGEVVWSWRRDRGVYPPRLCGDGNGDNKRRSPGRARISRKAIAWGKPGCLGWTCSPCPCASVHGMPVCSVTWDLRVHRAPGFPCALSKARAKLSRKAQAKLRREKAKPCAGDRHGLPTPKS